MDVALALLLISASVALFVLVLEPTEPPADPLSADRTAETLAASTVDVTYSMAAVQDSSEWREPTDGFGSAAYSRTVHGSPVALLADAAAAELRIDGERTNPAGNDYERAVSVAARESLVGAVHDVHVVALWRPFPGSNVNGRATIGDPPPADADVSTVRMRVDSGIPTVDDGEIEAGYRESGYPGAARPVARAIVRGYFPLAETQAALEGQGFERAYVRYRYARWREALGDTAPEEYPEAGVGSMTVLSRTTADAGRANDVLIDALARVIAASLEDEYPGASAERLAAEVSTGRTTVIVRTW